MNLRILIREIVENIILNEIGEFEYNKKYSVPPSVQSVAKNALSKISTNSVHSNSEGSGENKARDLAQGQIQTYDQVRRIRDFFSKHKEQVKQIKTKHKDKLTQEDVALLNSWDLHGGDAGLRWIESTLGGFHDENMRTKKNMRIAGGATLNKGMGIMDKTMMSTTKSRSHIYPK